MIHYRQECIIKKKWPRYYKQWVARYPLSDIIRNPFLTQREVEEIKILRTDLLRQLMAEAIVAANVKAIMMSYEDNEEYIKIDAHNILHNLYKYYNVKEEIDNATK